MSLDHDKRAIRIVRGLGAGASTVVLLRGAYDYATRCEVAHALTGLQGDVIVDLSWCTRIHPSVLEFVEANAEVLRAEPGL